MNIKQCIHLFAQREKTSGRSGSVYFEGDTIYSYGTHFPMAKFHNAGKLGNFVLFTSKRYSNTTAKHLSHTRFALRQYKIIECPDVSGRDHKANIQYFTDEIEETAKKAMSARVNGEYLQRRHSELIEGGNDYIKLFAVKGAKKFKSLLNSADFKKKIALAKEAEIKRNLAEVEKQKKLLEKWILNDFSGNIRLPYQYLRMKDGETVETTTGAEFPLSHAKLALVRVRYCKNNGTTWKRNGEEIRVGVFHIDSIDSDGNVIAGCHKIQNDEIERFAKLNNL
jgi:hypothetical protein